MFARGMILDMQRINESGRSMHEIPRYTSDEKKERAQGVKL
jgi:hypothetical protein